MSVNAEENIKRLFEKEPSVKEVFERLQQNGVKYGIFAGASVSILTSSRESTDVDILVADDDFQKLQELFKGRVVIDKDKVARGRFYYLEGNEIMEFCSKLDLFWNHKVYPVRLKSLA